MIPKSYNLPDFEIFNSSNLNDFKIWIPDKMYIVIGRSNNIEDSVFIEKVKEERIEIFKRPSGGETVILSPKTAVISVKLNVKNELNVHHYFKEINTIIISALSELGIKNLNQKGISDISIGNKKILGSSIYRKPDKIFYHAVLNISEDVSLISKYLKHPKKEPDYRKGRSHDEFVTSINKENYMLDNEAIIGKISNSLSNLINK
ncbi:MAG: hypothetical protein JXR51_13840 [Bacteroidales bacterium]|nr:hypothetical protein [Bacteroidales bacterium]MBN2758249.1 hypothetical protein [Bacteroidales bacterium]